METRNELLSSLRERLGRFIEEKDTGAILSRDTLREMKALLALTPEPSSDPEVLITVGYLHWFRYQVLPQGEDQQDLRAALTFFAPIYQADPEAVPGPLRTFLAEASPGPRTPGTVAEGLAQVAAQLAEAGNPGALDEAVDLLRQAVAATASDHPDRVRYLFALDDALERRFQFTGTRADIDEAVDVSRQAVAAVPSGHTDHASALSNLGNALGMRFDFARESDDLEAAIKVGRLAMVSSPPEHPARAQILSNLGANLFARFQHADQPADLDQAIDVTRQAIALLPPGHPARPSVASTLGNALEARFRRTHDPADLDEAIKLGREAIGGLPSNHPMLRGLQSNLNVALRTRFERTHQRTDIDEAIELGRQAAATTTSGHIMVEAILGNLVNALRSRFEWAGDLADLDGAVEVQRQLVAVSSRSDPDRINRQTVLGQLLLDRFRRRDQLTDLDEAIEMGRQATHSGNPDELVNLATTLQIRYGRLGKDTADLDEAIENYQLATVKAPRKSRVQMLASSGLSAAFRSRYEHTGNTDDLEAAIEAGRRAAVAPQSNSRPVDRADALSNLGNALRRRFERYGNLADLDESIRVSREAVTVTPESDPETAMKLSNFAGILYRRFELTGELTFLDEAIKIQQQAAAANLDPPDHAILLGNLGGALRTRFERTGVQADLDQAIVILRQALAATSSGHADRPRRLSGLANALHTRFEYRDAPEDLDEAIEMSKQALAAMPARHADRARYLVNLGNGLAARADRPGADGDLDQAIGSYQQAVAATLPSHPIRAAYLVNLAAALRTKFTRTGASADLDQLIEACKEAASTIAAPPHIRARAARLWGQTAADSRDWAGAAEGYAMTVEFLGRIAPRSLDRSDQEYWLGEFAGVGNEAAACFLRAGQRGSAVEIWEHGRGVLLSQALDTRTDLAQLIKQHPHLATEFLRLCKDLDDTSNIDEMAPDQEINQRHKLADELDQIIDKIREKQGFERFLLPPLASELLSVASQGPIALLNVSNIRSDALLLKSTGMEVVPLPDLTPNKVAEQVARFITALDLYDSPGMADYAEQQLLDVLAWIWKSTTRPVLDQLGFTEQVHSTENRQVPRIWWCPSGLLAFLPLHAAGDHSTRFNEVPQTVLDRVVSSYTPTVRALMHARRAVFTQTVASDIPIDSNRLLVVAMPHTPGEPPLREVVNETVQLRDMCPAHVTILHGDLEPDEADKLGAGDGTWADYESVREALPRHRWTHFACHSASDMTRPSASHVVLTDHHTRPLTVVDLARLRLADAELAFLSACSTARTARPRLADEAIHLSAAFQLAGYRHVIATLWPIGDKSARYIATQFYTKLISDRSLPPTADAAAFTLHNTILQLRNSLEARSPWKWAAHMHSGV